MEHRPNGRDERESLYDDGGALYGQKFARVVSKYRIRAGVMYFRIRAVRRWSEIGMNTASAELADNACAAVPAFVTDTQ